jgi:hypothetical protein
LPSSAVLGAHVESKVAGCCEAGRMVPSSAGVHLLDEGHVELTLLSVSQMVNGSVRNPP